MTLNELILAQQIEAIRQRNLRWTECTPGPWFEDGPRRPGGVRRAIAAALVRAGLLLDRRAAETAATPSEQASQQEVRHAL